jgi:hypothetical protein
MWGKFRHTKPKLTVDLNVLDFFTGKHALPRLICNHIKDATELDSDYISLNQFASSCRMLEKLPYKTTGDF